MKTLLACPLIALAAAGCSGGSPARAPDGSDAAPAASPQAASPAAGFHALSATSLEGEPFALSALQGKVALVVNVASECGYTPQYAGLQALHETYAGRGFVVLGVPSNEFGGQEPGTPEEIRAFCTSTFGVTFPLLARQGTRPGPEQSPLYAHLVQATGEAPDWNFCKYLVGRDGKVLGFWKSRTAPDDAELKAAIERALAG